MISQIIRQTTNTATKDVKSSVFWIVITAVTLICFLSGPFGTLEALPNGFRLIYWALSVVSTGLLGLWTHALLRSQNWQGMFRILLVSGAFGFCASGLIIFLNLTMLNPIQKSPGVIESFGYSFPTATVIFFVSVFIGTFTSEPSPSTSTKRPALMERLEKYSDARQILALCAQDHYVEVITEMGSELCLIRFNDAIAEAVPEVGIQVHRSHWVAKSGIKIAELKGASPQVRLINGKTLNISQSRLKEFELFIGS
jgi:hypothetical protein